MLAGTCAITVSIKNDVRALRSAKDPGQETQTKVVGIADGRRHLPLTRAIPSREELIAKLVFVVYLTGIAPQVCAESSSWLQPLSAVADQKKLCISNVLLYPHWRKPRSVDALKHAWQAFCPDAVQGCIV